MFDWINGQNISVIVFFIGLAGVIMRKNMMMTVIATGIMNTAIILAFVTMNASVDHDAPMVAVTVTQTADPVPQALMITSVVIGVAVNALMLVLILNIYRAKGTINWEQAKAIREGRENATVAPGLVGPIHLWDALRERLQKFADAF